VPKTKSLISVVDDDESMREAVRVLMKSLGFTAEAFASAEEFLNSRQLPRTCCLITDVQMPGMTGPSCIATWSLWERPYRPF
jgi:FixJ family two-component response regulator